MSCKNLDSNKREKNNELEFRSTYDNFYKKGDNNEIQKYSQNNIEIQSNKKLLYFSKKNKGKDMINYDTKIYSISSFVNYKNKKNKNYEKLSLELKNLFNIWNDNKTNIYECESNIKKNDKEEQKKNINKNNLDISYDILDYINVIKKPQNERTMIDLYMIVNCLSKTNIGKYFREEFDNNKEIFEKLITFCSVEIQHKKFYKGDKVFNIGDFPDNFYIILQGKVDVVKPLQKKVSISGNNYFSYLMDLLKRGDTFTFNSCIENNQNNYVIEKEDINILPYIFISINLEKINIDLPIDFGEILSIVNMPPEKFGLTESQMLDNEYIKENIYKIKKCFPFKKISSDLIQKYYFVFDKFEKNEVIIYDYVHFLSLETNDYFGDSALDSKTTRNATIIASEDTDVGFIEMGIYQNNIGEEKRKIIKNHLNFLLNNFFFKKINPKKFQKRYFGYFIMNNFKKGDIIYRENEMPKYAYFIKEGKVELSTSKNILEMEATIEILKKKIENVKAILMSKPNKNKSDNEKNNELTEEKELLYSKINSNFINLSKHLNQKEKNKILILKDTEDIGIISFYFDCPYITNCIVNSNIAKIFKIDIKYLSEIMNHEKICIDDLNQKVMHKLQLFQDRFFNVNTTKLLIADKKEERKFNEIIKIQKNIKLKKILHKHDIIYNNINYENSKTKMDVNKFKELYKKLIEKTIDHYSQNKSNKNIKSTLPSIKSEKVFIINSNLMTDKNNRRNRTLTLHKTNRQKIKNISKEKDNNSIFIELNNKSIKNIYKKRIKKNFENEISNNRNNIINKKNNYINSNSIEMKNKKNDSVINYFEKYFNNISLTAKTPLIFSKNIFTEEYNNKDKDKNKSINYNKNNINNNANPNYNIIKNSRNNNNLNYNTLNKGNTFSSFRNLNNSKNNNINNIFSLLKNKNSFYKNKKLGVTTIHFSKNANNNIINKEKIINSYTDKGFKFNSINKIKQINHPYYSPAVLIKKEKYNIFTKNDYFLSKNKNKEKINENKKLNELGFFSFSSEKRENEDNKNYTMIKYKKIL